MTFRPRLESALDAAVPAVVAAAVLAAAAGSSIQRNIFHTGLTARWVLLGVLLAFAALRAWLCGGDWRFPRSSAMLLAAFCGLSLVSVAWSVHARGTLERAVAQPVVVVAVALLAGCVASRPALGLRLLDGVLAAAAVVALAGFVYWLVEPSHAAIAATTEYPSRYQGIEESPNTAALLLAIAMPLAVWRALNDRSAVRRGGFVLLALAFAASISASGSRGGLAAGFLAVLVVALVAPRTRRLRLALAVLTVAGLAVSAWAMTIPKALPAGAVATHVAPTRDAERVLPLNAEIGNPWWTHRSGNSRRSLFNTSVRLRALRGTVHRALERPLLGYGFGAEQWAFVNRYYAFDSENPENGYVGILLQLGTIGLGLWLLVLVRCVVPGVRECWRRRRTHPFAAAAVGAAAGAVGMGISQSYFHGPGGIGYVALWISLLVTAVAGVPAPGAQR